MTTLPVQVGVGVDVSAWQNPKQLLALKGQVDWVYVRASHGATPDQRFIAHVQAARSIGARVGAYHFFELPIPVPVQFECFATQLEAAGVGPGDGCPALDLERNGAGEEVSPAWSAPASVMNDRLVEAYGGSLSYVSPEVWALLGRPAWILKTGIWLAEYTGAPTPDSPGGVVPTMWQDRVAAFERLGPGCYRPGDPGVIDQSRIYLPVPTIPAAEPNVEECV